MKQMPKRKVLSYSLWINDGHRWSDVLTTTATVIGPSTSLISSVDIFLFAVGGVAGREERIAGHQRLIHHLKSSNTQLPSPGRECITLGNEASDKFILDGKLKTTVEMFY